MATHSYNYFHRFYCVPLGHQQTEVIAAACVNNLIRQPASTWIIYLFL